MTEFTLPHQHGEKNIQSIRSELAQTTGFEETSAIFKQLSDPTRLQIFWILCHHEECVINIAALLDMSSPAVSHHLRSLHESGLIASRRDGKEVYYRVSDTEGCDLIHKTVEQIMEIACPKRKVDYSGSAEDVIQKIHDHMTQHLSDRITIEDLSRQFLMNPTTLKKVFKEVYGTSLALHMKQHRMEKAAELLVRTDLSISQIALAVGYESQSRFTAAFKDAFDTLPTAYRKKMQDKRK
ncbi:MAG: metalloregulator ArsR/SmtB family transcription factor [Oscillospiraceae bacterium]|nr:metalloregulator ArsR/SmtB family transcription factor [Oscillospiraceae bacterium]